MKASFIAAALSLATFSSAQFGLPKCANSCILPALKSDGCGLTDFKCHCQQDDLIPKIQPCVESKCTSGEQQQIITAVESLCAKQGVSISISEPSSSTATSSSSSGSSTSISDTTTFSHPILTSPTPKGNGTATFTKPTLTKPTGITTTNGPASSSSSSGGATSTDAPDAAPTAAIGGLVAAVAGIAALAAGL